MTRLAVALSMLPMAAAAGTVEGGEPAPRDAATEIRNRIENKDYSNLAIDYESAVYCLGLPPKSRRSSDGSDLLFLVKESSGVRGHYTVVDGAGNELESEGVEISAVQFDRLAHDALLLRPEDPKAVSGCRDACGKRIDLQVSKFNDPDPGRGAALLKTSRRRCGGKSTNDGLDLYAAEIDKFLPPAKTPSLFGYECLSRFGARSDDDKAAGAAAIFQENGLEVENFKSSGGLGSFFGRIANYDPTLRNKFSGLIDRLMKTNRIETFIHLRSVVCLYDRDLTRPKGGATLKYAVVHEYCTNECQSEQYMIRVELAGDGAFAGSRLPWTPAEPKPTRKTPR